MFIYGLSDPQILLGGRRLGPVVSLPGIRVLFHAFWILHSEHMCCIPTFSWCECFFGK